jgi:hypothetical protein
MNTNIYSAKVLLLGIKGGKFIQNSYVFIFKLAGGKNHNIVECTPLARDYCPTRDIINDFLV